MCERTPDLLLATSLTVLGAGPESARDFKPKTVLNKALPAIYSFRRAWESFHPDSETYQAP